MPILTQPHLRPLRYLRENNHASVLNLSAQRKPIYLSQISLMIADIYQRESPQRIQTIFNSHPRARAHRVFQKYQCRSVYILIISLLRFKFSLIKCHHSVVCCNLFLVCKIDENILNNRSSRLFIFCLISFFVLYKTFIFDSSILFYRYFLSKIRFHDVTFALLRGNVSVPTIQRLRFYDIKFPFLYRNGNAN